VEIPLFSVVSHSEELARKWRLILGKQSDPSTKVPLEGAMMGMDDVLEALYDSDRDRGLGPSSPHINRWLGDIRQYFPTSVVQMLQKDALDKLGLEEMLLEPELLQTIEPDVELVSTLLNLQQVMPNRTRETAREIVRKLVEDLEKRLRTPLLEALRGALHKSVRNRRPKLADINWHATIRANLKNYQPEYKTVIPERLIGHGRRNQQLKHVILAIDQSGSMSASVVYSSILGSIMASLRSLKIHLITFDTSVVDFTDKLDDPVDLLFASQLGGGTHIDRALRYAQGLVTAPQDTILILISDLMEGAPPQHMLKTLRELTSRGVQVISLLALNDKGAPAYDKQIAAALHRMDIPTFACTPDQFPRLMAAAIQSQSIQQWLSMEGKG
jgi:Mg-chelatase subunit ChlD